MSKTSNFTLSKIRDFRVKPEVTIRSIDEILSGINSPKSLAIHLLLKYEEFEQLVNLGVEPLHYNNAEDFRLDLLATSLLSKNRNIFKINGLDRKELALKKFRLMEAKCRQTNLLFKSFSSPNSLKPVWGEWLLNATSRKIEMILGKFDPDEFIDTAYWGPGATTQLKRMDASAVNKFASETSITRDLADFVEDLLPVAYPLWWETTLKDRLRLEIGNKVTAVPKNAKIDRIIAIEPGLNLWFQKSIGTMIRRRLGRFGLDINTQERNQNLARIGSKYGSFATVDFSSASDTISREVVRRLFDSSPTWLRMLELTRSHYGYIDNDQLEWEKFSSMGNGFTFELETLIFYCAALSVQDYLNVEGSIVVFGDDVVLPTSCYQLFSEFSEFLGFIVNPDKSYASGQYRESCGSHYFRGFDVKPFFLKEKLTDVESIYKLANNVRRFAHRSNFGIGCDKRFLASYQALFSRVPKYLRYLISEGYGDGGFISNFDEAVPAKLRDGLEGYSVRCLTRSVKRSICDTVALLLLRLKVASEKEYGNSYSLSGRAGIKVMNLHVPRWYNLGPWI